MSTFPGLALLVIKSLLGVISQILDQVAALKKQIAAFQERLAELRNQIASLRAQLDQAHRRGHRQAAPFSKDQRQDHPKRPGRKPGQGRFSFRDPPDPGWATEPPVEVGLTEPVCPWCGQPLEEAGVESASTTEIPPHPQPTVRFYRVHVYRCRSCGQRVRASHPDLAPDQYGTTAHRVGPRVMATAHVLHYGVGIPVRKEPTVLRILTGIELTESAIVQDAQQRVAHAVGQEYRDLRQQIPTAAVVHTDDTGWRIGGVPAFLMTFETDTTTVYQIRSQHRNEEVREVIPTDYPGVLVTDRGTSYDAQELAAVKQQKCLPHVLRSISRVLEHQAGKSRLVWPPAEGVAGGGVGAVARVPCRDGRLGGVPPPGWGVEGGREPSLEAADPEPRGQSAVAQRIGMAPRAWQPGAVFGRSRDPAHEQCGGAVVAAGSHRGRCRSAPRRAVGRRRSARSVV